MSVCKRGKKHAHWHYYMRVRGVRYRGVIPEARTKYEAEQAEIKIKREIFEGRFGKLNLGSEKLADFIEEVFLPWSKANKRSWRHDEFRVRIICEYFGGKMFREIFRRCWLKNSNVNDANRSQRGRRFVALPQSIMSLRC